MFFMIFSIFLILTTFLYYRYRYPYVRMMNKIPGPDGVPIFGVYFQGVRTPRQKRLKLYENNFDKFGPIVRVWAGPLGVIYLGSAEAIQTVLSPSIHIEKPLQFEFLSLWLGSGLFTSQGNKWRNRRRLLTPAFHSANLEKFFDTMVKNSKLLVEELESETNTYKFNIVPYVAECSLHIICETAMGVNMHEEKQLKKDYLESVDQYCEVFMERVMNPFLYPIAIFRLSSAYSRQMEATKVLHEMSMNLIRKRVLERQRLHEDEVNGNDTKSKSPMRKEFLDVLLDIWEQDKSAFTIDDVREEVDTFMLGGYDTISLTLYWTIYLVGLHPDIQEKVHSEVDDILGTEHAPSNLKMLQKLQYLECVIKETLRLYPVAPVLLRTLGKDEVICGYEIPERSMISINIHQVHRSPEHYHNPNEFDPSHFFPENANGRHPFAYIPFSGGPRNCPGAKFALLELKTILATFFKHYKVKSLTERKDMFVTHDLLGRAEGGIWVQLSKRLDQN